MENNKKNEKVDPNGKVNERELEELADVETPDGGTALEVTIAVSTLVSAAACPSTKCTSAC